MEAGHFYFPFAASKRKLPFSVSSVNESEEALEPLFFSRNSFKKFQISWSRLLNTRFCKENQRRSKILKIINSEFLRTQKNLTENANPGDFP